MSISTTIIPFQFDEEAFKAQIESEVKAGVMDLEALTDLRLMVLETMQSVTVASDNFSDIFSDADGYLNSVVTASTTSEYDSTNKLYANNLKQVTTIGTDISGTSTNSITITLTANEDNIYLKDIRCYNPHSSARNITIAIVQNSVTLATQTKSVPGQTTNRFSYLKSDFSALLQAGTFTIVLTTSSLGLALHDTSQTFTGDLVSCTSQGFCSGCDYITFGSESITSTEIVSTYNKAKPTSLYFVAFSGVSTSTDVGDLTIELLKDTTSLGVFNAFEIYNNLTLTDTPNKLKIIQADTSVSKIKKFCLLVD